MVNNLIMIKIKWVIFILLIIMANLKIKCHRINFIVLLVIIKIKSCIKINNIIYKKHKIILIFTILLIRSLCKEY